MKHVDMPSCGRTQGSNLRSVATPASCAPQGSIRQWGTRRREQWRLSSRAGRLPMLHRRTLRLRAEPESGAKQLIPLPIAKISRQEGPSADLRVIWGRLWKHAVLLLMPPCTLLQLALPYWNDPEQRSRARWRLAAVVALTLGTTGVSVLFNFLGRDFFNAISEKDTERFREMLVKWGVSLCLGIPVFVFRDYTTSMLALEWRAWMTRRFTSEYFADRTFYQVQAGSLVDNPDQRISADVRQFTDTALGFSMTILNAVIDLISFSGILYSIYPPLFAALLVYSVGGTTVSIFLGRRLVGLNFKQETQEANFRYGLVRIRDNAESIAFYGGEASEQQLLTGRLTAVVDNYRTLLTTTRNLDFFTSFYRFLIQILPAAVVAPLFFQGKIGFGVINQSSSAFNHILSDVSLVVYQFESLATFSAVVDRLGEFQEVLESSAMARPTQSTGQPQAASVDEPGAVAMAASVPQIRIVDWLQAGSPGAGAGAVLLDVQGVTLQTPTGSATLVQGLTFQVQQGESLLVVGPSGAGKTSILRAIAGLWSTGTGTIARHGQPVGAGQAGDIFFVPQRPYVVLGALRDQLLYPTWADLEAAASAAAGHSGAAAQQEQHQRPRPPPGDAPGPGPASAGQASLDADQRADVAAPAASNGSPGPSGVRGGPSPVPLAAAAAAPAAGPRPSDEQLAQALWRVQLGQLLEREGESGTGLDAVADWAGTLSLGEQQRLAFARVLLSNPRLVLMDESTSALDTVNEQLLYAELQRAGITYVSVGHRPTLTAYHQRVLRLKPGSTPGAASSFDLLSAKELQEAPASA